MQVAIFVSLMRDQLLPESLSKVQQCKTVFDVVSWRKRLIRALTEHKVVNEQSVIGPQCLSD